MGGTPPYGYDLKYEAQDGSTLFVVRFMPDGTKEVFDARGNHQRTLAKGESIQVSKKDRARLVPSDPARVEVAKRIFTMATVDEKGLGAIADTLNREGVPTPRGPKWARIYSGSWSKGTVRAILDNPIYCGDMVWNRRTDARFFKIAGGRATERKSAYGARLVPNPEVDWIRIPDAHPALVSHRLAVNAQRVRTEREVSIQQTGQNPRVVGGWVGKRSRFLLSGLIVCGRCGARYEGVRRTKGKRRDDGSKVVTYSYGCGGYIRNGRSVCTFGPLPQIELEEAVIRTVLDAYARFRGPDGRTELARVMRSALRSETGDLKDARERARQEITKIDSDIARLLDHLSAGTREVIEERITILRGERAAVRGRIEEFDRIEVSRFEAETLLQEVGAFIDSLEWSIREAAPEQRVAAARRCLAKLHVMSEHEACVAFVIVPPVPGWQETATPIAFGAPPKPAANITIDLAPLRLFSAIGRPQCLDESV
ncbi:MAG: recombinase family protein [Deltaproteobacteria bacterium]|nr:recombinase family protein [Deltaproteobacteria bacterium]